MLSPLGIVLFLQVMNLYGLTVGIYQSCGPSKPIPREINPVSAQKGNVALLSRMHPQRAVSLKSGLCCVTVVKYYTLVKKKKRKALTVDRRWGTPNVKWGAIVIPHQWDQGRAKPISGEKALKGGFPH